MTNLAVERRELCQAACSEFDSFAAQLTAHGVRVVTIDPPHDDDDAAALSTPDAVFPNNWLSTHADGTVVTYPMLAPSRRLERRDDVVQLLAREFGLERRVQLEQFEQRHQFLEGTGSMVLDRRNKLCYACLSERTNEIVLAQFCKEMGYKLLAFAAVDVNGVPVYHTNVVMALGFGFVVICLDAVPEAAHRQLLRESFAATDTAIVEITLAQMGNFAGNMLQLRAARDEPLLVMSARAASALSETQLDTLRGYTKLLTAAVPQIETVGGGSVRCMLLEIFPRSAQ